MTHLPRAVVCALLAVGLAGTSAFAQAPARTTAGAPAPRVEISGGAGWLGGGSLGVADADLAANSLTPEPFTLFATDSRFGGSPFVEARASFALTRRYAAEARFTFGRPELRTSVSGDVEQAAPLTVAERVDQYVIGGGIVVMLDELRFAGVVPFAAAGAGYVRQLHEGATVIEHGHLFNVGGGVKHLFFTRDRGAPRAAGLRADARVDFFDGGIQSFEQGTRPQFAASGALFVSF